jgi:hypothetical protein
MMGLLTGLNLAYRFPYAILMYFEDLSTTVKDIL